ncbi:hypothetical protein F0L68_12600 [Solihabitans fulvus]|uniref:Uncharacterized protein n=1 Tax=Solihabitans fulvus TaxID=1892852 RepID=A0A5B2XHR5_9PSEU|nr:hypothetical protein [Solihabitans fulvus]KAA2262724.1 hypothetical protein F0L68_12600 [Solihabitans fulvus]
MTSYQWPGADSGATVLRSRRTWGITVAAVLAATLGVAGCSSGSTPTGQKAAAPNGGDAGKEYRPTGPLMVDTGFRPDKDGFGFQNYGNEAGITNLTPDEMRKLFGDKICADAAAGKCDLTPQAQLWMEEQNAGMNGGHCYGMSVASLLLWKKKMNAADLGGQSTLELVKDNAATQKAIAYTFVHQALPSVKQGTVKGTPNEIVDRLLKELKPDNPETWTIGFYKRDGSGGHAVTPYAVEDNGNGKAEILIYDNNFPKTVQRIEVDRKANTWKYTTAANPNDPAETYEGDASTPPIELLPANPGLPEQPFPLAGAGGSGGGGSNSGTPFLAAKPDGSIPSEVFLEADPRNHGHLLITDSAGHRTGFVNGKLVNEIPGATAEARLMGDWDASPEPVYTIPAGVHFKIALDGKDMKSKDKETVGIIGATFDLAVEDINLNPGEQDVIDPSSDNGGLTYTASKAQSPTITFGATDPHSYYTFTVQNAAVGDNGSIGAHLAPPGQPFTVDASKAGAKGGYTINVEREDDKGVRLFKRQGIALESGDTAAFDYSGWDGGGQTIALAVTHQGKKTTQNLTTE